MSLPSGFGKLRALLWPIYGDEHKKFVPMFLIFFFICFNYSILRIMKESLVVTAPCSGAEALPFLKVWAVLPATLGVTFIFTRLSNWLSKEKVFYAFMLFFLGFFLLFTCFLFPYRNALHPNEIADKMQAILPQGFVGLIAIFRNWTFTLFYIMSEMWSIMMMTILFWGFANDVTSVRVARRFYAILGIGASLATIISGQVSYLISDHQFNPNLWFGTDRWDQALHIFSGILVLSGLISTGLFRWLHLRGLGYRSSDEEKPSANKQDIPREKKIKMGIRASLSYLVKSKYLICIAIVVIVFNVALTLIEVVWKDLVNRLYPDPNDFNAYMSHVLTWVGIVATLGAFVSSSIMRRFSWMTSAMIPPVVFLFMGVCFFSFLLFQNTSFSSIALFFGATPLTIGVLLGSVQEVLARACKYTLFDATKELAFIPLNAESRMKGKAAIDGLGSRLGKSGASVIHQGLIVFFGSIALSAPFVGIFLLIAICGWIGATRVLGKEFHALSTAQEEQALSLETEANQKPSLASESEIVLEEPQEDESLLSKEATLDHPLTTGKV